MKSFIIAAFIIFNTASAGFSLYGGLYGGLEKSTDSILYDQFKEKLESESEYFKNVKVESNFGKLIGVNLGAELSLLVIRLSIEAFGESSIGKYKSNITGKYELSVSDILDANNFRAVNFNNSAILTNPSSHNNFINTGAIQNLILSNQEFLSNPDVLNVLTTVLTDLHGLNNTQNIKDQLQQIVNNIQIGNLESLNQFGYNPETLKEQLLGIINSTDEQKLQELQEVVASLPLDVITNAAQGLKLDISMKYSNSHSFGALAKVAFNLWLFDLYVGAGIAKQYGNMDVNITNNLTCNPINYKGKMVNPCITQFGNFSSNMIVGTVGIQRRFGNFGAFLDLTTYIPMDINFPKFDDATIELLEDQGFQTKVKGLKASRTVAKLGLRYYFY